MPMSTRQAGNVIENKCCKELERLGYYTFCARGSRGPVDIFAVHLDDELNYPHLAVQAGTRHKSIGKSLLLLLGERLPAGTIRIVARYIRKAGSRPYFLFHTTNGKATDLADLLRLEARHGSFAPWRPKPRPRPLASNHGLPTKAERVL